MIPRLLEPVCFNPVFGRQMRFVAGPRQTGKTTLAKRFLRKTGYQALYYNWDVRETRKRFREHSLFFLDDLRSLRANKKHPAWVCFDEIHKMPKWKNILKGAFNAAEERVNFIITGSARLELFRRAGDSLSGRYFLFRLFPLTLYELSHNRESLKPPPSAARDFVEERLSSTACQKETLNQLLACSGFPEPFTRANASFSTKWHADYVDRLVREDLRDVSRIRELENIVTLIHFLPERTGSPLSINSLREDIEVSYNAVRNYLKYLELCYITFGLSPYTKKLVRSVKKEQKCYFFDWYLVKNPAARFENYLAVELKALTGLWSDARMGTFDLKYVRTREGKESDFLITRDDTPWLLCEAKLSDGTIVPHHHNHASILGNIPFIQLTAEPGIIRQESANSWRVSASRFFG